MKVYWGSGGIVLRILDIGARLEVSGQLHALVPLPPGKEPCYPLGRRLGRPQSSSDTVVKRIFPAPVGNRTLEPRSSSP
jgi:hypothetical protein